MDDPSFRVYRLRSGNRKDAQEIRVIAQKNSTGPEGNRDSRTLKTFFVTDTVAALESSFCRMPLRVFAFDTYQIDNGLARSAFYSRRFGRSSR